MPRRTSKTGSELFIVDNSDEDWKVLRYLHDWCQLSKAIDIASGYFEIGSLLALGDEWPKVDAIRILMGDEVSNRTKAAFARGLQNIEARLDASLEAEKDKNDFLVGVPAIVEAIRARKIQCKVYRQDKFHAKCYLTHARQEVVGSFALVGSSNFTYPGITENIELNVQIGGTPVAVLQEWYEQHWNEAEDVTTDILRVIERHIREYTPFEVYAKALREFFRGHELTAGEWELAGPSNGGSRMYDVLDQYQKEGYQALVTKARRYGGAFLCDGVGLGKTFVGLMLIERRIIHEGKNVALFVPKAAADPVWKPALKKYLPHIGRAFTNLQLYNHTDLQRGGDYPEELEDIRNQADVIIIDEAHHYRIAKRELSNGNWRKKSLAVLYRPFDLRFTINDSNVAVHRRERVLRHMTGLANLAICTNRQVNGSFKHVFCSRSMVNDCALSTASKERTYILPLYLVPEHGSLQLQDAQVSNLSDRFLRALSSALGLRRAGALGLPEGLTPEDIFHYVYAVLHSPGYRSRYAEFLKSDFPRLPLTGKLELFRALARLGGELTVLHVLESPKLDKPRTEFIGKSREVEKVGWTKDGGGTIWIDAGGTKDATRPGTSGFRGVPENVWDFHIGGYQVCEKWLKDRKGRTLTKDDITHYHKIVVALSETIRLMAEIDRTIDAHGGWPGAFNSQSPADADQPEQEFPFA
jgi:hypothetical protein